MKRKICILLAALLLLSGCGQNKPSAGDEPTILPTDNTAQPTESKSDSETHPWEISQNHEEAPIAGAYVLDEISVPLDGCISSLSVQDHLALVILSKFLSDGQSDILTVYDLSQKQSLWEIELEEGFTGAGFLSDGSVCLYWSSTETLAVYGRDRQKRYTYEGIILQGNLYADDAEGIWLFSNSTLHHLYRGTQKSYPISFTGTGPTIAMIQDGRVLYSCWQGTYCSAYIDPATGEQDWLPFLEGFCAGDGLFYQATDALFSYCLDGTHIYSIPFPQGSDIIDASLMGEQIVIRTSGKIFFLNLETGSLSELEAQEYYRGVFADRADSLLLRFVTAEGEQVCCLREPDSNGTGITITETVPTPEQIANREKAQAISDKYGIYVQWLPRPAGTVFGGQHRAENSQTDADITAFLDTLDTALGVLPADFFRAVTRDKVRCVTVSSLQGIVANTDDTVSSSGAFVESFGDAIGIVFNTSPDLLDQIGNGTLVHEMLHVLECAMRINHPDTDFFQSWSMLNPEGFAYSENPAGYWGGWEYVFDYYVEDTGNVYFVTEYSKVNAREDRATMFAAMCFPYDSIFQCPNIRAKADYLAQLLMEYYPELYEGGDPIWLNYQK